MTELLGGETYVSCSVVLPALRHLTRTMEVSDDDPAYVVRFKAAFKKDLSQRQDALNHGWLRVATALDPRFKVTCVMVFFVFLFSCFLTSFPLPPLFFSPPSFFLWNNNMMGTMYENEFHPPFYSVNL